MKTVRACFSRGEQVVAARDIREFAIVRGERFTVHNVDLRITGDFWYWLRRADDSRSYRALIPIPSRYIQRFDLEQVYLG